jgi:hypothetical protein
VLLIAGCAAIGAAEQSGTPSANSTTALVSRAILKVCFTVNLPRRKQPGTLNHNEDKKSRRNAQERKR